MASDGAFGEPESAQRLTSNAPSQIPRQARAPQSRTAASAIPDGSQTAIVLPGGIAINSPA